MSRSLIERLENELQNNEDNTLIFKKSLLYLLLYKKIEENKQFNQLGIIDMNNYINKLIKNSNIIIKKIPMNLSEQITEQNLYEEYKNLNRDNLNNYISKEDFNKIYENTSSLKNFLNKNDYLNLIIDLVNHKIEQDNNINK